MKVVTFLGRSHHVLRLEPVIQGLLAKGHSVLRMTADNSINNDAHTETLVQYGLDFVHDLDYLEKDDYTEIDRNTTQTLKAIMERDTGHSIVDTVEVFWIVHSVREACKTIVSFRKVIEKEKPDVVMALHANNFWGRVWLYCGQEAGIPTVGFMEGLLRKRDQDTQSKQSMAGDYVSNLLVWSEGSLEEYVRAGIPRYRLAVTGMCHLDHWLTVTRQPQWKKIARMELGVKDAETKIVTFTLPLLSRYEGDAGKAVQLVADWARGKKVRLVISTHPFDPPQARQQIRETFPDVIVYEGESPPLLAVSDLVLAQHSTVVVEALAFGTTVCEVDFSGTGILEAKSAEGVAHRVTKAEQLDKILAGEVVLDQLVVEAWKEKNLGPLDTRATERAVKEIEGLA